LLATSHATSSVSPPPPPISTIPTIKCTRKHLAHLLPSHIIQRKSVHTSKHGAAIRRFRGESLGTKRTVIMKTDKRKQAIERLRNYVPPSNNLWEQLHFTRRAAV